MDGRQGFFSHTHICLHVLVSHVLVQSDSDQQHKVILVIITTYHAGDTHTQTILMMVSCQGCIDVDSKTAVVVVDNDYEGMIYTLMGDNIVAEVILDKL